MNLQLTAQIHTGGMKRVWEDVGNSFVEDVWTVITPNLEVKGLMSFHDTSRYCRTLALKEFVDRLNNSTLSPQDLKIKTVANLIKD